MSEQLQERTWLGQPDRFARRDRVLGLDPAVDYEEITRLFYQDFGNLMLVQAVHSLIADAASPRIARILHSTQQMHRYTAKRILDTSMLTQLVIDNGFGPGPGRDASRRVNAMHRRYDIHDDDFVYVGCDNVVQALSIAERFGWRPVTVQERIALPLFFARLARVFGAHQELPQTAEGMREAYDTYVEREVRLAPENVELAAAVLAWAGSLVPEAFRAQIVAAIVAHMDPRIAAAVGLEVATEQTRTETDGLVRAMGHEDPRPDGAPDGLAAFAAQLYGESWTVEDLGTHAS